MQALLAVALGGSLGALSRYGLSLAVARRFGGAFPYGTLACNLAGCLLIGALLGAVELRPMPEGLKLFLVTGLLGSLTTFSTFGWEAVALGRGGQAGAALAYVGASVFLGLLGVAAARAGVRWVLL